MEIILRFARKINVNNMPKSLPYDFHMFDNFEGEEELLIESRELNII